MSRPTTVARPDESMEGEDAKERGVGIRSGTGNQEVAFECRGPRAAGRLRLCGAARLLTALTDPHRTPGPELCTSGLRDRQMSE